MSDDVPDLMAALERSLERLTPAEWAEREGIIIVDPDGWRHDRKSMEEPIHHGEWERRRNVSTIANRNPDGSW